MAKPQCSWDFRGKLESLSTRFGWLATRKATAQGDLPKRLTVPEPVHCDVGHADKQCSQGEPVGLRNRLAVDNLAARLAYTAVTTAAIAHEIPEIVDVESLMRRDSVGSLGLSETG